MAELTNRQMALLKMIIEEYIENAEPISSSYLTKKHRLNVSAATVRNEMAALIRAGFLDQPHVSAGRQPTSIGYKFYIQNLMEEESLPVLKEVAIKQNVWNNRYEFDKLLKSASVALAEATHMLAVISTEDNRVFSSGMVNLLDHAEFFDIEVARAVLNMVDNYQTLYHAIQNKNTANACVVLGEEFESESLYPVSAVVKSFNCGSKKGHVIVIGPARMDYKLIIPSVKYVAGVLDEVGSEW